MAWVEEACHTFQVRQVEEEGSFPRVDEQLAVRRGQNSHLDRLDRPFRAEGEAFRSRRG